ncbi:MAG TPA: HD domain-containing phosphohydrolase [Thermoguttaceae bacterium]|nr:HD domain-containing phosphohydrolase [Thermoguttaceae bacterium]
MTLKDLTATMAPLPHRKLRPFTGLLTLLAIVLIVAFYDRAAQDRVLLSFYCIAVMGTAYVLVRRRAMAMMELVLFAAAGRIFANVYFAAAPGIADPVMVVLSDLAFWFVMLYLGWRLAAEAYCFQKNAVREEVAWEVERKTAGARGAALVTTSREIRQPLATMRTITDALLNAPPETLDAVHRDSLADMDRSIQRLMVLVNTLMDYGQAEAGMIHLAVEPVTLSELINQCVATLHAKAARNGVEIQAQVAADVGEITADPLRLKQVVFTLLSNSIELNKSGGIVNMQARRDGEHVLLAVRDTGKGISNDEMKELFDPYRDGAQNDRQIGASLGLSLAKRLVEMHGGSMTVDSVADSGNVFTVRLPIAGPPRPTAGAWKRSPRAELAHAMEQASADRATANETWDAQAAVADTTIGTSHPGDSPNAKPLEAGPHASKTRVLVADGNASVRRILGQWLAALDCEMVEAENGADALKLAHARPTPHVILLDTQLSGIDGYEVCHGLKSDNRLQLIPIILATSVDTAEEKIRAFDAGADDFLVKPINRAELTVRLRSLLRIYQFNQELIGAESVAMALARAVAAKDGYSQSHVGKVAHYAVQFGERLGMDVAELKILKYGAILHNVGKIAIPDAVLEKTGSLTPREMAMVHRHPQIGCDICAPLKPLQPVLTIIRHHKERWDGSGYPDRLAGEQIPLGAQVVGIVDAYVALISNRPYRKALAHAEAVEILRKQAGEGWYDPELCEQFLESVSTTETIVVLDEAEIPVAAEME